MQSVEPLGFEKNLCEKTIDSSTSDSPLGSRFRETRGLTEFLCSPLEIEDFGVQSMPDASPAKWHLAHTTWFFESFVLANALPIYQPFHPQFAFLFNSYYEAVGERWPKAQRGLLARPTVAEVYEYRRHVDSKVLELLERGEGNDSEGLTSRMILGLHHEQQHQELLLCDLKHAFATNPLRPLYRKTEPPTPAPFRASRWISFLAGLNTVGHDGRGFAFDNELPRHKIYLNKFVLADRAVTNGEYRAFMEDDGYDRPEFWLSDGWQERQVRGWTAPLYWERNGDLWQTITLAGMREIDLTEPVCHVSFYEADAFARWAGARLATEAEWEVAASTVPVAGNFLEKGPLHPAAAEPGEGLKQLFGDVWEWTGSAYAAYPGYRPAAGALGEYNGKFMCNQMVLRGGSCVTPTGHMRASYRNFFPPETRWQFTGIRLANDA